MKNYYHIRRLIILFMLLLAIQSTNAADYYWVGGPGNWTNLARWASSSGGPGGAYGQVPTSADNVFFDANSGLVAGNRVTLTNNSVCANMTWSTGQNNVGFTMGSNNLSIHGNLTLGAGQGWTTAGEIFFLGSGNHTITTNGSSFVSYITFGAGAGQYTVVDRFRNTSGASNVASVVVQMGPASSLTFQDSTFINRLDLTNGATVNYNGYVRANSSLPAAHRLEATHGTANFNSNGILFVSVITPSGPCNVNFGNYIYDIYYLLAGYGIFSGCHLNISGATLNVFGLFDIGVNTTANTTGSVINFYGQSNLDPRNKPLPRINFYGNPSTFTSTAAIDTLVLYPGSQLNVATTLAVGNGTTGLLRVEGDAFFNPGTLQTFNVANNCRVELLGGACNPLYIRNVNFNFGTGLSLSADWLVFNSSTATGPGVPYDAGPNSIQVQGSPLVGWTGASITSPPASRTLYWQGPIPANATDYWLYGLWHDCNTWSEDPTASPTNPQAPASLPTPNDDVVFPHQSYVRVDGLVASCRDMTWLQQGVLYDSITATRHFQTGDGLGKRLEIFGSLVFSPQMQNLFQYDVYFRTASNAATITMNGKAFNFRTFFEGSGPNARWTLQDAFRVVETSATNVNMGNGTVIHWWVLLQGYFDANGQDIFAANFTTGSGTALRTLDIQNATLTINDVGASLSANFIRSTDNFTLLAAGSHIHVYKTARFLSWGTHTFHDVTFHTNGGNLDLWGGTNTFRRVTFQQGGNFNKPTSTASNYFIQRLTTHASGLGTGTSFDMSQNGNQFTQPGSHVVDSALHMGPTRFGRNVTYNNLLRLGGPFTYDFYRYPFLNTTPGPTTQTLAAGAVLQAGGIGCGSGSITIRNGSFSSVDDQTVNGCIIWDNTAGTGTFTATNSQSVGTTTGWGFPPPTARTLYWWDGVAGNSSGQWSDTLHWSLTSGSLTPPTGNCPPTAYDTVIFATGSFNGLNDTVNINLGAFAAECADMRWLHDATVSPVLAAPATQELRIYGSLTLAPTLQQNFLGQVRFTGTATHTLTSAGKPFRNHIHFEGDGGSWYLQDNLQVGPTSNFDLFLTRGHLHTQGYEVRFRDFLSQNDNIRSITLYASQLIGRSFLAQNAAQNNYSTNFSMSGAAATLQVTGAVWVNNFSLGVLIATGATDNRNYRLANGTLGQINLSGVTGGNQQFYIQPSATLGSDIISPAGSVNFYIPNYTFTQKIQAPAIGIFASGITFAHLRTTTGLFRLVEGSTNTTIDTLIMGGNGDLLSTGNLYRRYVEMTPGRNYRFGAGSVQHIANQATLLCSGTGGNNITWQSSTVGSQAYLRMDSAYVCTDYVYLRDIWAIGDEGLNDTVLASSYVPTQFTSGRAVFTGGQNADDQGNNAGWDFTDYPLIPSLALVSNDTTICTGTGAVLRLELVGTLPIYASYTYDDGGGPVTVDSVITSVSSGSGTLADPFIWLVNVSPNDTTRYETTSAYVERCFNSVGTVSGDAWVNVCSDAPLPPPSTSSTVSCPADAVDPGPPAPYTDACGFILSPSLVGQEQDPVPVTCQGEIVWRYRYYSCDSSTTADWIHTYTITRPVFSVGTPAGFDTVNDIALALAPPPPAVSDACGSAIIPTGPDTSGTYSGCSGTRIYTFTYTDCAGNSASWTFTYQVDLPALDNYSNAGPDRSTCAVNIISLGGPPEPGYSYNWVPADYLSDPASSMPHFYSAVPGVYQYVLTTLMPDGCNGGTDTLVVTVYPGISATHTSSDVSCYNQGNGQIQVNVLGGTPPYTYSIDNGVSYPYSGPSPFTISNLNPGLYQVRVRDANGCETNMCR